MTKEQALQKITALVEVYEEHHESYHSHAYDEAKVRVDFINKFFKALGWDIDNEEGYAEAYREVILEDKLKIGGNMKAPDYGFTIGGNKQRKFYVEAKKPTVTLKTDKEAAWQLRNYGWNASATVSILTNFAEFAVYDCGKRPKKEDSAGIGRIRYFTYKDYVKEFDFIWDTFSKEGVLKGRFDKFVQADTDRRGTATVDKAFLESLNDWRKYLATSIAKNNHKFSDEEIGFVVQQTLDRIIFLRFCEDRGVEPYGSLKNAMSKGDLYRNLFSLFKEADRRYNSGLFDFKKDKHSEIAVIDNKVIKSIITDLYPPDSEYNFSVLPVEILGNAYEQFLGKVIRVTPGHVVKIDDKPEVRKAGGVYYTPQYIVNYIVEHTVGELIKDKTPKQIEEIKIVDPACGSGSFLLGAFEYLMDYHTKYYIEKATANVSSPLERGSDTDDSKKKGERGVLDLSKLSKGKLNPDGRLTSAEKKRILTNNVYGVDIDTQAVEVTKLSLLLKAMEGETSASVSHQLTITHERILPNLDNNIRCGNSLIGPDFYDSQLALDAGEEKKINVFDWKKSFPKIFDKGGFDAVIGNPPWGAEFNNNEREYLVAKFPIVPTKTKDSYFYFLFQSFGISPTKSFVGLVLPNTWLLINNANKIREFLLEKKLIEIIDWGDNVFKDAIVETSTIIVENSKTPNNNVSVKRFKRSNLIISQVIKKAIWRNDSHTRFVIEANAVNDKLLQKLLGSSKLFGDECEIIFGIKPYQLGYGKPPQTKDVIEKRIFHADKKLGEKWKPLLTGTDINRYVLKDPQNQYIKYGEWLMYKSNESKMLEPKIFLRRTSDTLRACYDDRKYYGQNSLFIITSNNIDLKFLLGLLNSSLFDFVYKKKGPQAGKIFAEIKPSIVKDLPIKSILTSTEKQLEIQIIKNVDLLLKLNETKQQEKLQSNTEQLNTRIAHSENRIDELVYELYGLTKEEIAIIEKETKKE